MRVGPPYECTCGLTFHDPKAFDDHVLTGGRATEGGFQGG